MELDLLHLCEYAPQSHWIIFLLLLLAGLNIPISEDLLLMTGGAIAVTCIPDDKWRLFIWLYMGSWLSAWEPYWIGRLLGPKLYEIRWFNRILTPKRLKSLHHYYEKFGVFTFVIGRFIPGGPRNALFLTSGLGRMPFFKFILRDGFACLISTTVLFHLGYFFAENYNVIAHYIKKFDFIALICFVIILAGGLGAYYYSQLRKNSTK